MRVKHGARRAWARLARRSTYRHAGQVFVTHTGERIHTPGLRLVRLPLGRELAAAGFPVCVLAALLIREDRRVELLGSHYNRTLQDGTAVAEGLGLFLFFAVFCAILIGVVLKVASSAPEEFQEEVE